MTVRRKPLMAASAIAVAFALPAGASAQADQQRGQQQRGQQQQQQQQQQNFSEQDIKAYANAATEISELQKKFQSQLQNAESAEDQQSVQEKANQAMIKAIKDAGLSLEKYNQIATAAQNNQELAKRIRDQMQGQMGGGGGGNQ